MLPDWYLARALDHLGRSPDAEHPDAGLFRVDYRDLSIQHLGHVYEGLLELQPHWAQEPMVVIRKINYQKTHEQVIPASQNIPKGYDYTGTRYETGKVFLVTDKGERRTTGSYYTPNYIVDYIVSQTLGPLCKEISDKLAQDIKQAESERKNARGRNRQLLNDRLRKLRSDFDDRVLRLKVLDPAMGSGHFLLRACQYLAEEIATNPNTSNPEADQLLADESLLTFWKRRVVEHCLYGVDINPLAVELAKVALWLETAAIGQPLAFLDHHLRCGNSLVGGWVADLGALPGAEPMPLFEQKASSYLPALLEGFKMISDKPSDTRDDVKVKTQIYNQTIDRVRKPFVDVADLWCATFFLDKANQITPDQYQQALQTLGTPAKHRTLLKSNWFKNAVQKARQPDVACFHWELEFPDIFFDISGRRPEAGFDAIIGNPPYRRELDYKHLMDEIASTSFGQKYRVARMDLWYYFVHRSLELLKSGGHLSFIVNAYWVNSTGSKKLIKVLRDNSYINEIFFFRKMKVFLKVSGQHMVIRITNERKQKPTLIKLVEPTSETSAEPFVTGKSPIKIFEKSHDQLFTENKLDIEPPADELLSKIGKWPPLTTLGRVRQGIAENPSIIPRKTNEKYGNIWEVGEGVFTLRPEEVEQLGISRAESKLLRPYHHLCDLGRYQIASKPSLVLIYSTKQTCPDINKYPNIFRHLKRFKVIMEARRETKKASNQWWHLHWPRDEQIWQSAKIVSLQMGKRPAFVPSMHPVYVPFSANVFVPHIETKEHLYYISGLLNSRLMVNWYQHYAKRRGAGLEINGNVFGKTPIRQIDFSDPSDKAKHDKMVKLVQQMLDLHKQLAAAKILDEKTQIQSQISATDKQIDQLVYELYGLTNEEIKLVKTQ